MTSIFRRYSFLLILIATPKVFSGPTSAVTANTNRGLQKSVQDLSKEFKDYQNRMDQCVSSQISEGEYNGYLCSRLNKKVAGRFCNKRDANYAMAGACGYWSNEGFKTYEDLCNTAKSIDIREDKADCDGGAMEEQKSKLAAIQVKLDEKGIKTGGNPKDPKITVGTSDEVYKPSDFSSLASWTKAGHDSEVYKDLEKKLDNKKNKNGKQTSAGDSESKNKVAAAIISATSADAAHAALAAANAVSAGTSSGRSEVGAEGKLHLIRDLATDTGSGALRAYSESGCFFSCEVSQNYVTQWRLKNLDPNLK